MTSVRIISVPFRVLSGQSMTCPVLELVPLSGENELQPRPQDGSPPPSLYGSPPPPPPPGARLIIFTFLVPFAFENEEEKLSVMTLILLFFSELTFVLCACYEEAKICSEESIYSAYEL